MIRALFLAAIIATGITLSLPDKRTSSTPALRHPACTEMFPRGVGPDAVLEPCPGGEIGGFAAAGVCAPMVGA